MAKWSGPKRTAGLTLTGKESRDALGRLNSLKPKWQERFFQRQGIHKDGHLYIAWSNLSGRLQQGEWIYPDDAHRWLHKLERKHKKNKNMALIKSYVFILEEDDEQSSIQGEGSDLEIAFKNAMKDYYEHSEWARRDYLTFDEFFFDWEGDFKEEVNTYFVSATIIERQAVLPNKNLY